MSRRDWPACAVLLIAALAWAMPLVAAIATDVPGTPEDRDVATMVWNVWWVRHALETRASIFHSEFILLPFGADLRLHTYGMLPAALVWPVAYAAGAFAAFNVMLVATIVLNGWFAFALFRELGVRVPAALVAASALMFSGPVLDQMRVGRPIFASTWIICAALIAGRRVLARPGLAWTLALGAALVAALFTDLQMLLYTSLWLIWLAAWTIARERKVDAARLAAGAGAVAIVAVPFLTIFYPAFAGTTAAVPSPEEAVRYSYRWWDYVTPALVPATIGGYELAIAAVAGAWLARGGARRAVGIHFWLIGAALFFVLALGPTLKFTGLPLPFAWLSWWPPLAQFRTPYRMTIPAVLGLAAVMALLLDRVFARIQPRRLTVIVLGLIAVRVALASAQSPLHTQRYPGGEVYEHIATATSTSIPAGAILEVPFGVRSGLDRIGTGGEVLQYYQAIHQRPILNAMIARLPPDVFAFYRRHPALLRLAGEPVQAPEDRLTGDLEQILAANGVEFVVVHHRLMTPPQSAEVDRLLGAQPGLSRWASAGDLVVYRRAR